MNHEDSAKKPVSYGPWGGVQNSYGRWDDGVYSTIRKVTIGHSTCIDFIEIEYDKNGSSICSARHGERNDCVDLVKLAYPEEYLTSVNGRYGWEKIWKVVKSLTFVSNIKTYGPYGVLEGTYFSSPVTGGKIVGFHGRSRWDLRAIGIYLKPLEEKIESKSIVASQNTVNDRLDFSVIQGNTGNSDDIVLAVRQKDSFGNSNPSTLAVPNQKQILGSPKYHVSPGLKNVNPSPKAESAVTSHGPWGGTGGFVFDDGSYTGIRQINLSHDVAIRSIKVCYDQNGKVFWGNTHGDSGGDRFNKVIFDYPAERLKRVTGTYGSLEYRGSTMIRSISFHSNRRKYGPFGVETGSSFTGNANVKKAERIVGFYGRESLSLEAIGVHVRVAGTTGSSDSSGEEPEEKYPGNRLFYRSFKITNFWGYH